MRSRFVGVAVLMAAVGVVLPGSALSNVNLDGATSGALEFDTRVGTVAPTKAQRRQVKRLKASVTWSQFGTPSTLVRHGKFLARGVRGKNPADAAGWYLNRHKALFGISSLDALAFVSANRLGDSTGWAVTYRQVFDGLRTSESGTVTVGVVGTRARGWRIVSVSSNLTRDRALSGTAKLSAAAAWATAAKRAGLTRSVANILSRKSVRGYSQFRVAGLPGTQLAKLVAFPTVRSGVVPAYETIVMNTKEDLGLRSYVDARTGRILARSSIVHNLNQGSSKLKLAAAESYSFSGEIAATDGACNISGPFAIGAGNRALDGFVNADNAVNDVAIDLMFNGALVPGTHADTFLTPERFRYEPAGGVPPGNYSVQVCDFDDAQNTVWAAPRTYQGTLIGDASSAPPVYLARWKAFASLPPLYTLDADPWNMPNTDTRQTWCWVMAPGCDRLAGGALASRGAWDHDHRTNSATLTTRGNNARSATSYFDVNFPSPPQYSPVSAGRDYSFTWSNDFANRDCNPDPGPTTWDHDAASVNLFVAHNRMHDWAYHLGFTERNWNAQDYNFGLTERRQENDPVIGNVQSGANVGGRNNANMFSLPDGISSVTNMYFWQPQASTYYPPCVDGDYDMSVIGHEYGHMIENRMIGKGNLRAGHHAGAMGESHGDMFGMEYLFGNGFAGASGENPYSGGAYDTGNKQRAIRNYGMNFPTSGGIPQPSRQLMINTLNFSDMGFDVTGPTLTSSQQVHANGEIWSKTNFQIRQLLIDKYDDDYPVDDEELQAECAEGFMPAHRCPGNRRWIQLVFDAMLLAPIGPSMLEERNMMLAADLARFGGANQKELWLGFARGGMGVGATSTNNSLAETDTDPVPDFEPVGTSPATVKFIVKNLDGDPITNARIFVGHHEARVSPIADTNPATPAAGSPATVINLDDTAKFAPGQYEFSVQANGYGLVRFSDRFRSRENETIKIEMAQNWASSASGATATGDGGDTLPNLIDDTERTIWTTPGDRVGGQIVVAGKKVTIDLGGTESINVKYVQVSAMLTNGLNRFSALRSFEVWTCDANKGANCATDAGYTKRYTSPADAFPGTSPRPVSPALLLRQFDIPDAKATHVRFVVRSTQCTGAPSYQGEQDSDPTAATDCDTATPASSDPNFARAAEFQVFRMRSNIHD